MFSKCVEAARGCLEKRVTYYGAYRNLLNARTHQFTQTTKGNAYNCT